MSLYPKIDTIWNRNDKGVIIPGEFTCEEFEYLQDNLWHFSEKVDGMNICIIYNRDYDNNTLYGRTENASIPALLINYLQKNHLLHADWFAKVFPDASEVRLFGEGVGPGIQNGGGFGPDQFLIVFDILVDGRWLTYDEMSDAAKQLWLPSIQNLGIMTLNTMVENIMHTAQDTPVLKSAFENVRLEGTVGHPDAPIKDRYGNRISIKIKLKDYLDFWRKK